MKNKGETSTKDECVSKISTKLTFLVSVGMEGDRGLG